MVHISSSHLSFISIHPICVPNIALASKKTSKLALTSAGKHQDIDIPIMGWSCIIARGSLVLWCNSLLIRSKHAQVASQLNPRLNLWVALMPSSCNMLGRVSQHICCKLLLYRFFKNMQKSYVLARVNASDAGSCLLFESCCVYCTLLLLVVTSSLFHIQHFHWKPFCKKQLVPKLALLIK